MHEAHFDNIMWVFACVPLPPLPPLLACHHIQDPAAKRRKVNLVAVSAATAAVVAVIAMHQQVRYCCVISSTLLTSWIRCPNTAHGQAVSGSPPDAMLAVLDQAI